MVEVLGVKLNVAGTGRKQRNYSEIGSRTLMDLDGTAFWFELHKTGTKGIDKAETTKEF